MTVKSLYLIYLAVGISTSIVGVVAGYLDVSEVFTVGLPTLVTNGMGIFLLPCIAEGLGAKVDDLGPFCNAAMKASWPMMLLAVVCCSTNFPDLASRVPGGLLVVIPLLLNWISLTVLLWRVNIGLDKVSTIAFKLWITTLGPFFFWGSSIVCAIRW